MQAVASHSSCCIGAAAVDADEAIGCMTVKVWLTVDKYRRPAAPSSQQLGHGAVLMLFGEYSGPSSKEQSPFQYRIASNLALQQQLSTCACGPCTTRQGLQPPTSTAPCAMDRHSAPPMCAVSKQTNSRWVTADFEAQSRLQPCHSNVPAHSARTVVCSPVPPWPSSLLAAERA